jgi:hypothetical protein
VITTSSSGEPFGHRTDRANLPAQRRREQLFELAESADRGFAAAVERFGGRGAKAHCHRHRLIPVEHQRRHRPAARSEPVAPRQPGSRLDRVPELAQPIDVASDRSHGDAEPVGELRSGPARARLQE